jgi:hypothetical protein
VLSCGDDSLPELRGSRQQGEPAVPRASRSGLFRLCSARAFPVPRIAHQAAEPVVDHGTGAVVGGRKQVRADAESERRVCMAEVLG